MGINPVKFGPYFWGVLHLVCMGHVDPAVLKVFIELFPSILPCPGCSQHFATVLKENPFPDSEDGNVLFKWSVHVHNIVNKRIGKPEVSEEEAIAIWTSMPVKEEPEKPKPDYKLLFIAFLILVILLLLWKISRN